MVLSFTMLFTISGRKLENRKDNTTDIFEGKITKIRGNKWVGIRVEVY